MIELDDSSSIVLEKCPFCGSGKVTVKIEIRRQKIDNYKHQISYFARCECGARGPREIKYYYANRYTFAENMKEIMCIARANAIDIWNRRK
ncbi:MAG: hypothetical protein ACI4RH_05345 [Huintestinicola sp.]